MKHNQYALSITNNNAVEMTGKIIANTVAYSLYVSGSVALINGLTVAGANDTDITLLAVGYAYGTYFGFSMIKSKFINPIAHSISKMISSFISA